MIVSVRSMFRRFGLRVGMGVGMGRRSGKGEGWGGFRMSYDFGVGRVLWMGLLLVR